MLTRHASKSSLLLVHLAMLIGLATPAFAQQENRVDLPLTRTVLFASGVGYFEHHATITGPSTMRLTLTEKQIMDMLKSLIVHDPTAETGATVSYPTNEPLDRLLQSYAIDLSDNPQLHTILHQLRGQRITVHAPEAITGTILNVESKTEVQGDPPVRTVEHIINLVTEQGIQSIAMSGMSRFSLEDTQLQSELNKALMALATDRQTARRVIEIHFPGKGEREVRFGYLIETPVWKTSYRLDLSQDKPLLQGWSIIENMTESDWTDVQLSMISGQPVSFVQDLYTPLFASRPVVEPITPVALKPEAAESGRPDAKTAEVADGMRSRRLQANEAMGAAFAAPAQRQANMQARLSDDMEAAASAERLTERFAFHLKQRVDLPRRRSAMFTLLNQTVEAPHISFYESSRNLGHPMHAVWLENTTEAPLMPGPITVFDDGIFAGDGLINTVPAGEKRIVSYAIDLDVTGEHQRHHTQTLRTGKIVDGVLTLTHARIHRMDYTFNNTTDKQRRIIINHPINHSAELIGDIEPIERSENFYRFELIIPAGETMEQQIREQQIVSDRIGLINLNSDRLIAYSEQAALPHDVREALKEIAEMRTRIERLKQQEQRLENQRKQIFEDQSRLRDNLARVGQQTQLGQRYVSKLSEQEDQIENIEDNLHNVRDELNKVQNELSDYLGTLQLKSKAQTIQMQR